MQRKWWTLLAVSVATFMLLLDITVVNTALPAIQEDLNASFTELQWVIDAYTLALAALVLTAGSLADRLGRRRVFAVGLGIFSVASLAAGLAPDPTFLNISRAVQGIGGAILFAVSLALVAQEFPAGRERGTAMGIYGATIGMSVAIGPLVGGALVDSLGWEWVFFINVPVGIAAIAVTYTKLRESRDPNATRVDWAGLATFSSALFLLVFGAAAGQRGGLGQHVHRVAARRRGCPAGGVRGDREPREAADVAAAAVPQARLHGRAAGRAGRIGLDVRAVPVHHVLPAEPPRAFAARGGVDLPAVHGGQLLHRRGRRGAAGPPARTGDHVRRARPDRRGPAVDGRHRPDRRVDRACWAASSWPAPAWACSIR